MNKPLIFNYKDYKDLREAYSQLLEDNEKLKTDNRSLRSQLHIATRIIAEDCKQSWIPCAERLPDEPALASGADQFEINGKEVCVEKYLVTIKGALAATALWWDGECWRSDDGIKYTVSAWQPMPGAFKE